MDRLKLGEFPRLGNIETRDGARQAIRDLHRFMNVQAQELERFSNQTIAESTPLNWVAAIASAAAIEPQGRLQPISGTETITQIDMVPEFRHLVLLSQDGFSLGTGGNIARGTMVPSGAAVSLFYNFTDDLWYLQI